MKRNTFLTETGFKQGVKRRETLRENPSESSLMVDKLIVSKFKDKKIPKKTDSELFNEIIPKRDRKVFNNLQRKLLSMTK